jgi:predicted dehydrogenase
MAHAAGSDTLKVGLIGCGGRGAGAAQNAMHAEENVKLTAMADAFGDRLESSRKMLAKRLGEKCAVDDDHVFTGFDGYKQLIDSDVDVVLLATPPHFRPAHLRYAIEKGKHVFCEKPVAVDGPGVRSVLETAQLAKEKDLSIVSGLCWRYDHGVRATMKRIQDGAIGDVVAIQENYLTGTLWHRGRKPEWSEMEYQMRNWYYFNWLCGDHIVEQHIHNLDVCNWIMGGPPAEAQGQGGRQVRVGPDHGEIFDHHMVEFTYPDGTKLMSQCRHIQGCWSSVSEHAHGTLGVSNVGAGRIESGGDWKWRYEGEPQDPYQVEHDVLFRAVREDLPHNEAEYGAHSTMTAILGRMATYSGKVVTFEQALSSELALVPDRYAWDGNPPTLPDDSGHYPIPVPGSTRAL